MRVLAGLLRLFFIFVLKELVELVGPVAHTSDVESEVILNLRGRADGEGMPFIGRNPEKKFYKISPQKVKFPQLIGDPVPVLTWGS